MNAMKQQKLPVTSCRLPVKAARGISAGNWQLTTNNSAAPRRSGFTFTQLIFAVILLRIGFITLAGMFPVAIQQTAQPQQETAGASLALTAVKQISQYAMQDTIFPTGDFTTVPPFVLTFRER